MLVRVFSQSVAATENTGGSLRRLIWFQDWRTRGFSKRGQGCVRERPTGYRFWARPERQDILWRPDIFGMASCWRQ